MKEMSPIETLRHSCAHIFAAALLRVFPKAKIDHGPPINNGFYYDLELEHSLTPEDLERIEAEMQKIVEERQDFECIETSRQEALKLIEEIKQPYKVDRLADIPEGERITFYRNGEFLDLCAGPHIQNTKEVKAFKLLSIAGTYYRGDANKQQLQRVYGTAFPNKKELRQYLDQLEEAKKRDHRKLGKDLELFSINEKVGPGLPLWLPNGAIVRHELQNFIAEELRKQGYEQVFTPHIGKLDLYRTSGHFPYYQDSQFAPIMDRGLLHAWAKEGASCADLCQRIESEDADGYLLKPMNCPMHVQIYKSAPRSYRDLPVRLAEFGTVYRWEQSGELNGLTRVRGMTQDDAHLFCREDQLAEEIQGCLELVKTIFKTLKMEDYRVRVGLRDPDSSKYTGDPACWDKAEDALRKAVKTLGVDYSEEPGEAAFYGPKIDFVVNDVIGRPWQLGTIQVDYTLPERFDLSYIGSDNKPHRPVMIHRAPFGSMERFCGVLIEHFGGAFPTWLAPNQVRILPLNDSMLEFSEQLLAQLKEAKIRASIDSHADKLGAKIRRAEMAKAPYMLVIGPKEAEEGQVSVRSRNHKSHEGTYSVSDFIKKITTVIAQRALPENF